MKVMKTTLAALAAVTLSLAGCMDAAENRPQAGVTPASLGTGSVEATSPTASILERMRTTRNWGNADAAKRRHPYNILYKPEAVRKAVHKLHFAPETSPLVKVYFLEGGSTLGVDYVSLQVVGPENPAGVRKAFGHYAVFSRKAVGSNTSEGISFHFEGFLHPDGTLRFAHGGRTYRLEIGDEESRLFASNYDDPWTRSNGLKLWTVEPWRLRRGWTPDASPPGTAGETGVVIATDGSIMR